MTIRSDIFELFDVLTDEPVVFANGNGPRPGNQFVTILVTPADVKPVQAGRVDDDGKRKIYSSRTVDVRLQVYGPGAWGRAEALTMALQTEAALDRAEALNIGLLDIVRVQDVPALMDNAKYEERAIVDLSFHYVASTTEDVSFIEAVMGSGQINDLPDAPFTARTES